MKRLLRHFILLLLFSNCLCDQCITYNFEQDFDTQFSSNSGICTGLNSWTLYDFSSLYLESPHYLSTVFISPSISSQSCVSSFNFPMPGGTLEVKVYMKNAQPADYINVFVMDITGGFVTNSVYNTLAPNFKAGWNEIKITTAVPGDFGFIVLMGSSSVDSVVLVDSFRYIPPSLNEDADECAIYREDTDSGEGDGEDDSAATGPTTQKPDESDEDNGEGDGEDDSDVTEPTTLKPDESDEDNGEGDGEDDSDVTEPTTLKPDESDEDNGEGDGEDDSDVTEPTTLKPDESDEDNGEGDGEDDSDVTGPTTLKPDESDEDNGEGDGEDDSDVTEPTTLKPDESDEDNGEGDGEDDSDVTEPSTLKPDESGEDDGEDNGEDDGEDDSDVTEPSTLKPDESGEDNGEDDGEDDSDVTEPATPKPDESDEDDGEEDPTVTESVTPNPDDSDEDDSGLGVTESTTKPDDSGEDDTDLDVTTPNPGDSDEQDGDDAITAQPDQPDITPIQHFWNAATITMVSVVSAIALFIVCMVFYYLGKSRAEKEIPLMVIPEVDYDKLPKPITVPRVTSVYDGGFNSYGNSTLQV